MTAGEVRDTAGRSAVTRAPVQNAALMVGGMFLVGVLGFVPGVIQYDQLTFAVRHSGAALWGLFTVSVLLDVVHLAFGAAGMLMARKFTAARIYLMGGGLIYLVLFAYGVLIEQTSAVIVMPVVDGDNWMHLRVAVGMLLFGATLGGNARPIGPHDASAPKISHRVASE